MKFCLALIVALLAVPALASDVSWIFLPGYYTHDAHGQRIAQYQPEKPSYVTVDPSYQESGSRHQSIRAGNDCIETWQTWGTRPYYGSYYGPYYRPYYYYP